jgi:hypothetical protein
VTGWQPIETAPEDGMVMVTDGEVFGAAKRFDYVEPQSSVVTRYWSAIAGWSAWSPEAEWEVGVYADASPKLLEPTHWMPLMGRPEKAEAYCGVSNT